MGFYKFAVIFRTSLLQGSPVKIICDPVKIETFYGSRIYQIPKQISRIVPKGEKFAFASNGSLILDSDTYIELIARTKEDSPALARQLCEEAIDRTITMLSMSYSPDLFCDLVYRGWLLEEQNWIAEAWIKVSEKVSFDQGLLTTNLQTMAKKISSNNDLKDRFTLMSRFYVKALVEHPSEEQFIWLWTALEVFPMKNTTDIKPIGATLSTILHQPADTLKQKLGIGQLFGLRSDLVHNGKLNIDIKETGEIFSKLHNIVYEILRFMSGAPYGGTLNKYL